MASFTQLDVISNAIILLGQEAPQTLTDDSKIVDSANRLFALLYPNVFTENMWRFAVKQVQLSQLTAEPVVPNYWQYIYAIPGDFLKTIRQYPQNYQFEIFAGQTFYSMLAGPLYLEYVYQVPIEECPPYFIKYLVYELASLLALSNAQNVQFAQFLEQKATIQKAIAQAMDSQNRPQTPLASAPVLNQRFVSYTSVNG